MGLLVEREGCEFGRVHTYMYDYESESEISSVVSDSLWPHGL